MVDEKAWAVMTVFAACVVTVMGLLGAIPVDLVLIVGFFAAVLLIGVGVLVLGEIRDGMRGAR
jgi:hypothetical protein